LLEKRIAIKTQTKFSTGSTTLAVIAGGGRRDLPREPPEQWLHSNSRQVDEKFTSVISVTNTAAETEKVSALLPPSTSIEKRAGRDHAENLRCEGGEVIR
jgi:hypothetical protein